MTTPRSASLPTPSHHDALSLYLVERVAWHTVLEFTEQIEDDAALGAKVRGAVGVFWQMQDAATFSLPDSTIVS